VPVALGRRYVAAPPFAPHRFGLFSVVDQPTNPDSHWRGGVETQPNPCDAADTTVDSCPTGISPHKNPTANGFPTWGANPFTVFAEVPCSPAGLTDPGIAERTVSALRFGEERAVERVVWTGITVAAGTGSPVYPHLASAVDVFDAALGNIQIQAAAQVAVTGTPNVTRALGALEGAFLNCYGGEGVLHIPAEALAPLVERMQIVADGPNRYRTWNGLRVAVYASNNREGPTGVAPASGRAWFYATGAISMRRSDIQEASSVQESLDRSNNTYVYIAERTYVLNWDCCSFAVQTDLTA
jgi:hypothetical protein